MKAVLSLLAVLGVSAAAHATCPDFKVGPYTCVEKTSHQVSQLGLTLTTDADGDPAIGISNLNNEAADFFPMSCVSKSYEKTSCTQAQRANDKVNAACDKAIGPNNEAVLNVNMSASISALEATEHVGVAPFSGTPVTTVAVLDEKLDKLTVSEIHVVLTATAAGKTLTADLTCTPGGGNNSKR